MNPDIEDQISSNVLLEAKMAIETNEKCNADTDGEYLIDPVICVGYAEGAIVNCQVNMVQ